MNKEEWLISEVDKWQQDSIISEEAGDKIKKQYELYRNFNGNIFAILCAVLGAALIVSGIGLISFYTWRTLPSIVKVIIGMSPLVISYIMSIFTLIFKSDKKIWKESSALLNTVSMFFVLAIVISEFHFDVSLSQYLIIGTLLTIPMIYIMQAVSPLVIYYVAIIWWGSLNISLGSAPILLGLFLLGTGVIGFNITKYSKTFRYNAIISALAGFPIMILISKMLNGDTILAMLLYSTLLFAMRDLKRGLLHFKLIGILVSLIAILCITSSQAWGVDNGEFGGMSLGILTGVTLLGSLALEVFNTKENNFEFSYLLLLMLLSIIRYVWGCLHSTAFISQIIFMALGIILAVAVALGFVLYGKKRKRIDIASIGFGIIALLVLIKIFEINLFFLWRAVAFLVLGSASLILVIFLTKGDEKEESPEVKTKEENEDINKEDTNDGGEINEENNTNS